MKKLSRDFPAPDISTEPAAHGLAVRPHACQAETIPKAVCPSMKDIPLENPEDRKDQYRLLP